MVRLKALPALPIYVEFEYFNSNMVRLKAKSTTTPTPSVPNFNSNMVRLKGRHCCSHRTRHRNFNSNMVRLKVFRATKSNAPVTKFQFQYGAIKRTFDAET